MSASEELAELRDLAKRLARELQYAFQGIDIEQENLLEEAEKAGLF